LAQAIVAQFLNVHSLCIVRRGSSSDSQQLQRNQSCTIARIVESMNAIPEDLQQRLCISLQAGKTLTGNSYIEMHQVRRRSPAPHRTALVGLLLMLYACAASPRGLPLFCGTIASPNWAIERRRACGGGIPRAASIMRRASVDPGDCKGVRSEATSGVILPPMEQEDPGWLSFMIARYLDDEWTEQQVHEDIGAAVAELYKESREAGDDDMIAVLAKLSYGLKDMFKAGQFQEAFEGPIDIANRAAEFLMLRLGRKVWSYGRSNDEVQKMLLGRIKDYEAIRQQLREA